ncbi:peptidoglycan-binding protein [Streptomyces sp. NPDC006512]|uniref:peptidoglycan-binding domain-containing protein n=1 Tax=Streptomyces sp. NPDC006512 TaxID=3154307 RepID=UPI0033AF54FC
MSHHTEESGLVPDDRLLVRPYVTPPAPPARATTPAWPLGPTTAAVPASAPTGPVAPTGMPRVEGRRGSRRPLAALSLLALAAAGALVVLLRSPEPPPARAVTPPGLSVPALPARSPDTGDTAEPDPAASAAPSGSATAGTPAPAPAASTAPALPTPPPTTPAASPRPPTAAPAKPAADTSGTLRPGDRGPEVRALQERLYGQGFTYVSTTGVYDGQTQRGVAQLQRDRGIKGDPHGVYGPATRAAFG